MQVDNLRRVVNLLPVTQITPDQRRFPAASSKRNLPVENYPLIPRSRFSDADPIASEHVRSDLGWIITGKETDDFCAGELLPVSDSGNSPVIM